MSPTRSKGRFAVRPLGQPASPSTATQAPSPFCRLGCICCGDIADIAHAECLRPCTLEAEPRESQQAAQGEQDRKATVWEKITFS